MLPLNLQLLSSKIIPFVPVKINIDEFKPLCPINIHELKDIYINTLAWFSTVSPLNQY